MAKRKAAPKRRAAATKRKAAKRKCSAKERGDAHRKRMAARSREASKAAGDIGKIPRCRAPKRMEKYRFNLYLFLVECFPKSTGLKPFCDEQKQVADNLQEAILNTGQIVHALPRGFAKTAITARAALWALLYGHARYVIVYSASKPLATKIIEGIKIELRTNAKLFSIFPGPCLCFRKLENISNRARTQTYQDKPTAIEWKADRVRMPTLPDFVGSGAVLESKAIKAARGAFETKEDGAIDRPDVVLFDDPQDDESASNPDTVDKICKLIENAIMGGGHDGGIAAVINITPNAEDDVAERYLNNEDWVRVRFRMLRSMPTNRDLWDKYATILRDFVATSMRSKQLARERALKYYRRHRKQMDAGAAATWDWCYAWQPSKKKRCEISAVQHAMNLLIERGQDTFERECQCNVVDEDNEQRQLNWKAIYRKTVDLEPDVCQAGASLILGHVDVHDTVLNATMISFTDEFGAHVARFQVFPKQKAINFRWAKAKVKLMDVAPPGSDETGAIVHGLLELTNELIETPWETEEGEGVPVGGVGIDVGYNGKAVRQAIRKSKYKALLFPMKGKGLRAKDRPISEWNLAEGSKRGDEWLYGRPAKKLMKQFLVDSNEWKSFAAEAWRLPITHRHSMTLHSGTMAELKMFCQQASAERSKRQVNESDNRTVDEWELPPAKPDNHFADNVYNACVLANYRGIVRDGITTKRRRRRRRVTYMKG